MSEPVESRQSVKREGGHEDTSDSDGEPSPKRPSLAVSPPPQSLPSTSAQEPSPVVDPSAKALDRAFVVIEQSLDHSMANLGAMLVSNESVLGNSVNALRSVLASFGVNFTQRLENLREALGPVRPTSSVQSDSSSSDSSSSSSSEEIDSTKFSDSSDSSSESSDTTVSHFPLTHRLVKKVLRLIGRIFHLFSIEIYSRNSMDLNPRNSNSTVANMNHVAKMFGFVMSEIEEYLEYSNYLPVTKIAKNLEKNLADWKHRVMNEISKAIDDKKKKELGEVNRSTRESRILQVNPRLDYPTIAEPSIRYEFIIPSTELLATEPQVSKSNYSETLAESYSSSLSTSEENLYLNIGPFGLVNGSRTTQVNHTVLGISIRVIEMYVSDGWVDSTDKDAEGLFIRSLNVNLTQFQEGSVVHRVEIRPSTESLQHDSHQIMIRVSGILNNKESQNVGIEGQRVEFVFKLPHHLKITHINDVGVRDGVLAIQFAK